MGMDKGILLEWTVLVFMATPLDKHCVKSKSNGTAASSKEKVFAVKPKPKPVIRRRDCVRVKRKLCTSDVCDKNTASSLLRSLYLVAELDSDVTPASSTSDEHSGLSLELRRKSWFSLVNKCTNHSRINGIKSFTDARSETGLVQDHTAKEQLEKIRKTLPNNHIVREKRQTRIKSILKNADKTPETGVKNELGNCVTDGSAAAAAMVKSIANNCVSEDPPTVRAALDGGEESDHLAQLVLKQCRIGSSIAFGLYGVSKSLVGFGS